MGTLFFVTAAGKPDILATGGVEAAANRARVLGHVRDQEERSSGARRFVDGVDHDDHQGVGYTSPLSVIADSELTDFTYSDGTGGPSRSRRVVHAHHRITGGTDEDEWQMGVVGKGCLPEYLTNGNVDSDFNPEYLAPGSGGDGRGIEYVASEPGSLELGLWSGATTDCSGSPRRPPLRT